MLKLIANRSTWLQLFTILALLTTAWSCSLQEEAISDTQPTIAEDITPPGKEDPIEDCYCVNNTCNTFDITHALTPLIPSNVPNGGYYDFCINVVGNHCDLSGLIDDRCDLKRKDYILNFAGGLALDYFEDIAVFDLQGTPTPHSTDNAGITAHKSFNACFKLKPAYSETTIQTESFTSGGICIIGIVTDPENPGGIGGVSPPDDNG